ncbi:MAG: hypothetical protein ACE5F6_21315 [Anaerolineae bacterium]
MVESAWGFSPRQASDTPIIFSKSIIHRASGKGQCPRLRFLVILVCLAAGLFISPPISGQGSVNRAGLVIQHSDGTLFSTCVTFDEPSISGLDLLRRAGVSISQDSSSGLGAMICALGGEGCNYPDENCLCQCQGATCTYWQYWHLIEGEWQYSSTGAGDWDVANGSVDGWAWGVGDPSGGEKPPATSFDALCAATPTAVAPATSTPALEMRPESTTTSAVVEALATPTPVEEAGSRRSLVNYWIFAAIVLVLVATIVRYRRRT